MDYQYKVFARAVGRSGDELRMAASGIAGDTKTDWMAEKTDTGTLFSFESKAAQAKFRAYCTHVDIPHHDKAL